MGASVTTAKSSEVNVLVPGATDNSDMNMPSNTGLALQVVVSNISAPIYLIILSITLCSLIGTLVGASTTTSSSNASGLVNVIIFGDKSVVTAAIKYVSLLVCFLTAFMAHVQCIRYYIHVSFLISTPHSSVPVDYIENSVIRGNNFWSLGLRAYYFAFPLLLWIFGPIPMFVCVDVSEVHIVKLSYLYDWSYLTYDKHI